MKFDQELQIQAYLDGELSARETRQVEQMLAADREAQALLGELKMTRSALAASPFVQIARSPGALRSARAWRSATIIGSSGAIPGNARTM